MNPNHVPTRAAVLTAASLFLMATSAQSIPGLPEPGFVMYGTVTGSGGSPPLSGVAVAWRVAGPNGSVNPTATFVAVNGQPFYLVRVPFETRSIPGAPAFASTPGTLELTPSPTTYTRSATVNGATATLQGAATFTFGRADNGKVERVNLVVDLPSETFAQWAQRVFGTSDIDPEADADQDGASNFAEFKAGTDPLSSQSAFKFVEVVPASHAGIIVRWSSIVDRSYTLERSAHAESGYAPVALRIQATSDLSSFVDSTAAGPGPFFYRLRLD